MNTSVHHSAHDDSIPAPSGENFIQPMVRESKILTRWLASGAIAGPVLLTLAWIILGSVRPGYSQLRQQVSDLGLGSTALFMNTSFILSGLLILAGVIGIKYRLLADVGRVSSSLCAFLLALSPLGTFLLGFFTETNIASHVTAAMLMFLTPLVSFLVTGLILRSTVGGRTIGNWLLVASPLTLVLVVIFFQTGAPGAPMAALGIGGLSERVMAEQIVAWYAILGWLAVRRSS